MTRVPSFLAFLSCLVFLAVAAPAALAQSGSAGVQADGAAGGAMRSLIRSEAEKLQRMEDLRARIEAAGDDEKKALQDDLKQLQQEVAQLQSQFDALATGGASDKFALSQQGEIDIQKELQQLVQPLVIMLKMATAESRQIETLRHKRFVAASQLETAREAVASLEALREDSEDPEVAGRLDRLLVQWRARRGDARDFITSLDRQIETRLNGRETAVSRAGAAFTDFIRDRGLNFLLGTGIFTLVFIVMQFARRFLGPRIPVRISGGRSFRGRVFGLFYQVLTVLFAVGSMLYVFNARNDWLLMTLAIIFLLAAGWVMIKMLPNLIEQIALLLNLGAVQEGERVVFNGVPWLVTDLSYYTTLVNPLLSAGTVTLPVRELIGLHSRPLATDEAWFPSREGEWVKLSDEHIGEVVFQSPEMVQIRLFGGAVITYTTETFLTMNPVNLSHDYRVEVEFGIDYAHQAIATTTVREVVREEMGRRLLSLVPEQDLVAVNVDFLRAGASSLDFEVEADIRGRSAHLCEDVERALAAHVVDICTEQRWSIPFPQLTVHRAG